MKTKLLTLFCCFLSATTLFAADVLVGELYYNLNKTDYTAEVTYSNPLSHIGVFDIDKINTYQDIQTADIPSSITVDDKTYSVTSIGVWAFYNCKSLTTVTIPNSVTSIGNNAFSYCPNLTSATIGNSVTSIGEYAFCACSLTSVTIPNSVTSIGNGAFSGCSGLTSVAISNSMTSIGEQAFFGCSSLTSVTIPNSVTTIGEKAFCDCSSLTSIEIPNSVTTIGQYAFYNCSSMTSVTIGKSVTSIEYNAFPTNVVKEILFTGTMAEWCTKSFNPSSISSSYTLYIDGKAVTNAVIPNSVTSIGNYAFSNCLSLTSVTIPNNVTTIGNDVFSGCSGLNSVTISSGITNIEEFNFNKLSITEIHFIGTLEEWLDKSWNPYPIIVNWDHSYNLYIGNELLTSLTIPNGRTTISDYAFWGCKSLTSVTIPNSLKSIERMAFHDWEKYGLESSNNINEIHFIGTLEDWCNKEWDPSLVAYDYDLYINDKLATDIVIPANVTFVKGYAFKTCKSLTSVTLGESMKLLEYGAFYGCNNLKTFKCFSSRPPTVQEGALYEIPYSAIVYVPKDYLEAYKMHDVWGLYDVRPMGAVTIETNEVTVTPTETTADVAWPVVTNAATYELVIKDKSGNIICTLVFNAQGQLTSIAFNAPDRDRSDMPEQAQAAGFSFTVTGLEQGTTYNYTLTAKNSGGNAIDTRTGSFTTDGATALENVSGTIGTSVRKVMENGVMYLLLPDGTHYDAHGIRVK
ncbi:MAG: leucine-rich repeat domain-containing protein [Paludibacteraceae bacterium]|nr:leucine-rich repeat domain-containing protein [Paludibacteraceae bacterium]